MRKYTLLLLTATLFASCYTYKTYDPSLDSAPVESSDNAKNRAISVRQAKNNPNSDESTMPSRVDVRSKVIEEKSKNSNLSGPSEENKAMKSGEEIVVKPQSIIKEKGYYQIDVFDKTHTIEAVKWQGDTLISHVKGQPKKELKFHEKDIQNLKVRQFSKGRSDALTVAAYATAGVGLFLLLK